MNHVRSLQIHNILKQLALVLVGVYFTHSILTDHEIGVFETLLLMGYTVSYFWMGGFQSAFLAQLSKLGPSDRHGYLGSFFFNLFAILLIICASLYLFSPFFIHWFELDISLRTYNWFIFYLLFSIPSVFVIDIYTVDSKGTPILVYAILNFLMIIGALILPLYLGYSLDDSLFYFAWFGFAKGLWLLFELVSQKVSLWPSSASLKKIYALALPMMFYSFLGGLAVVFDSWLVKAYFEDDVFANFRYGAKELPLATAMAFALYSAAITAVAQNLNKGMDMIKKQSISIIHIVFAVSIIVMIFGDQLFAFFFTESFLLSAKIFKVYLLLIISRSFFPHAILMAKEESSIMIYVSILEILINIVFSLLLMNWIGIIGIPIATVIAYSFEKVFLAIYLRHKHDIKIAQYTPVRLLAIYSVVLCIAFYIFF